MAKLEYDINRLKPKKVIKTKLLMFDEMGENIRISCKHSTIILHTFEIALENPRKKRRGRLQYNNKAKGAPREINCKCN